MFLGFVGRYTISNRYFMLTIAMSIEYISGPEYLSAEMTGNRNPLDMLCLNVVLALLLGFEAFSTECTLKPAIISPL